MEILAAVAGLALIAVTLWDAFETVVLPRRVSHPVRLTRAFYRSTWWLWTRLARVAPRGGDGGEISSPREAFLGLYGPLALIVLLSLWAAVLVVAFAMLQWSLGSALAVATPTAPGFGADLYMSGTTFFTLGLGDVVPRGGLPRALAVIEAGTGFAFLALVIGYLPVLYQAFSRREADISLLDARAGSPPSATELIRRNAAAGQCEALDPVLQRAEEWSAQLLESHLSYPSVAFFRSQHENQSWLAALTATLDASALVLTCLDGIPTGQARATFAIARHTAVDLAQLFDLSPTKPVPDRLPAADLARLRTVLAGAGIPLRADPDAATRLTTLRGLYEPYVAALGAYLLMALPPWLHPEGVPDDWQTTPWAPPDELPS
ncbi:MAG: potassium channel family protein [Sphaerobacter sp.]|nr:potassium channel family protein [Sphaerobacter sp.]MDI3341376.1 potassium channel family protein [Sphaerobacter sp.]